MTTLKKRAEPIASNATSSICRLFFYCVICCIISYVSGFAAGLATVDCVVAFKPKMCFHSHFQMYVKLPARKAVTDMQINKRRIILIAKIVIS